MDDENTETLRDDDEPETLGNRVIVFNINDQRIAEAKEEFKDVDAHKDHDAAKKAKKSLTKMRTTLADAHKEEKADALAYGRRCDAEKNRLLDLIGEIEDPITEQLAAIKSAEAIKEDERLAEIMEGIEQIQAFALDRHDLTIDQLNQRLDTLLALKVDPEFYSEHTEDAENAKEVSESKLRIAIMNEETRLKELAEKEELEKKNKALQDQIDKNAAEQTEREVAQKVIDDAAAVEQKEKDDARQAELDKQAADQKVLDDARQAELDKQEEANIAARKLLDDVKAEDERKAADKEAAELAAIQAPDKEKLELFAEQINELIRNKPILQSDACNETMLDAVHGLIQVAADIRKANEEL